jgi:ankyrin repeat protein
MITSEGRMPLSCAGAFGNTAILKMLLDAGGRADYRDSSGATALHWAAQSGHPEVINMLVAANATVDAQNRQGITPSMMAATNSKVEAIRALIAAGRRSEEGGFSAVVTRSAGQLGSRARSERCKPSRHASKECSRRLSTRAVRLLTGPD